MDRIRSPASPVLGAALAMMLFLPADTHGAAAARAVAGRLLRGVGEDAAGEVAERGSRQVGAFALRHGDDAARLASRPGARALVARHGDDAATALLRHGALAGPLIFRYGTPAARALGKLEPRNARRLLMLHEGGLLGRCGRADELLDVIGRYGDRAMEFLWRHKGVLAGGAVLGAFLADPRPYLDGTTRLVGAAGGVATAPLAGAAADAARSRIGPVASAVGCVLLLSAATRLVRRPGRAVRSPKGPAPEPAPSSIPLQ